MLDFEQRIRLAMENGKAEARKEAGMSYTKLVPVPRTIADAANLAMNHRSYGLSADEAAYGLSFGINGNRKK